MFSRGNAAARGLGYDIRLRNEFSYWMFHVSPFERASDSLPSIVEKITVSFPLNYPFSLSPPSLVIFPSLFHSPFPVFVPTTVKKRIVFSRNFLFAKKKKLRREGTRRLEWTVFCRRWEWTEIPRNRIEDGRPTYLGARVRVCGARRQRNGESRTGRGNGGFVTKAVWFNWSHPLVSRTLRRYSFVVSSMSALSLRPDSIVIPDDF